MHMHALSHTRITHTCTVPTASLNFTLDPVPATSSQLSASWLPPDPTNGLITNYTIYCAVTITMDTIPPPGSFIQRAITTGSEVGVIIMDLEAYTFYQCYVTANTSVGEGPASNTVTERTVEDGEIEEYVL